MTNQRQLNKKTDRNAKVALAASCLESSGADGIWVVDSSLNDQEGTSTFEHIRFPGILSFHDELNAKLPAETITVAGTLWGINLILWARGLVRFPIIGAGKSSQYHISGGRLLREPRESPCRLCGVWSGGLPQSEDGSKRIWQNFRRAMPRIQSSFRLKGISKVFRRMVRARMQVARFYRDWFRRLEASTPDSRDVGAISRFLFRFCARKVSYRTPPNRKCSQSGKTRSSLWLIASSAPESLNTVSLENVIEHALIGGRRKQSSARRGVCSQQPYSRSSEVVHPTAMQDPVRQFSWKGDIGLCGECVV